MNKRETVISEMFMEYARFNTSSERGKASQPSSKRQFEFAKKLKKQCGEIGFDSVTLSYDGYIYCHLKGNCDCKKNVGFLAHMDTSPDFNGEGVNPRVVSYTGGDIELNGELKISEKRFPSLSAYKNQEIIVADGRTLLGADNKAGIAAILYSMEQIIKEGKKRPNIYVAFTPDEEIGRGMDKFDLSLFKADFAYTADGGPIGELVFECFNAAKAVIKVTGEAVHPGDASGIMKNAILTCRKIIDMLPEGQSPEKTKGREGYYHVCAIEGTVQSAELTINIRDFCEDKFEHRKAILKGIVSRLNKHEDYGEIIIDIYDEYYNMKEIIDMDRTSVDIALSAYEALGITPDIKPIRGGTDGSRLSFMGIPCPNIFSGGHNFHGPYEYLPVKSLIAAADVIEKICELTVVNY